MYWSTHSSSKTLLNTYTGIEDIEIKNTFMLFALTAHALVEERENISVYLGKFWMELTIACHGSTEKGPGCGSQESLPNKVDNWDWEL